MYKVEMEYQHEKENEAPNFTLDLKRITMQPAVSVWIFFFFCTTIDYYAIAYRVHR